MGTVHHRQPFWWRECLLHRPVLIFQPTVNPVQYINKAISI